MKDRIEYFPHRMYTWISPILFFFSIILHVGWVVLLYQGVFDGAIMTFAMAIGCTYAGVSLFLSRRVCINFDANGLVIKNDRNIKIRCVPWEQLKYGYCAQSYKGFTFLILSQAPLNGHQQKKLANQCANSSRVYFDSTVVFYLDPYQDTSAIQELVSKHVSLDQHK